MTRAAVAAALFTLAPSVTGACTDGEYEIERRGGPFPGPAPNGGSAAGGGPGGAAGGGGSGEAGGGAAGDSSGGAGAGSE